MKTKLGILAVVLMSLPNLAYADKPLPANKPTPDRYKKVCVSADFQAGLGMGPLCQFVRPNEVDTYIQSASAESIRLFKSAGRKPSDYRVSSHDYVFVEKCRETTIGQVMAGLLGRPNCEAVAITVEEFQRREAERQLAHDARMQDQRRTLSNPWLNPVDERSIYAPRPAHYIRPAL